MRKVMVLVAVAACAWLTGCIPPSASTVKKEPAPSVKEVSIASQFEADKAREMSQGKGNNTIKGSALMRQSGGGVVTCAGKTVSLVPAIAYAKEKIQAVYGNTQRGAVSYYDAFLIVFSPDIPYETFSRSSICDAQGFFKFEEVPDGEYFVTVVITWSGGSYLTQGGYLMQRVEVKEGKAVEVVLAP